MIFATFALWAVGALSMVCACLVAFSGDRDCAHQGMMEGLGFWVVAALLEIANRGMAL